MDDMTEDPWVWATDSTGRSYPMLREAIDLDPGRYAVDETHPVRDDLGFLLPTTFAPAIPAADITTITTESEEDHQ